MKGKKVGKGVFKILTGVVVGGAIGSILGLTLAPKKGSETRQVIKDKSMELFLKKEKTPEVPQKPQYGLVKRIVIKALKPKKKYEVKQ